MNMDESIVHRIHIETRDRDEQEKPGQLKY
jgi:hypothetical protein